MERRFQPNTLGFTQDFCVGFEYGCLVCISQSKTLS